MAHFIGGVRADDDDDRIRDSHHEVRRRRADPVEYNAAHHGKQRQPDTADGLVPGDDRAAGFFGCFLTDECLPPRRSRRFRKNRAICMRVRWPRD